MLRLDNHRTRSEAAAAPGLQDIPERVEERHGGQPEQESVEPNPRPACSEWQLVE